MALASRKKEKMAALKRAAAKRANPNKGVRRSMSSKKVEVSNDTPKAIGKYEVMEMIGKGGFGKVYRGVHQETGKTVAIKRIDLSGCQGDDLIATEMEIKLLRELKHPNIVRYIDSINTGTHLNIILEYVECGQISSILKKFHGSPPETLIARYTVQVLRGLYFLHQQGVIHRDIKGANILSNKDGVVKLADFGVATSLTDKNDPEAVGSPYWMAPEVIEMTSQTSSACDIWSLGCTVLELVTGSPPFFGLPPMTAMYHIVQKPHPDFPEGLSPQLRDFLMRCFQKNPAQRIDALGLLNHVWLRSVKAKASTSSGSTSTLTRSVNLEVKKGNQKNKTTATMMRQGDTARISRFKDTDEDKDLDGFTNLGEHIEHIELKTAQTTRPPSGLPEDVADSDEGDDDTFASDDDDPFDEFFEFDEADKWTDTENELLTVIAKSIEIFSACDLSKIEHACEELTRHALAERDTVCMQLLQHDLSVIVNLLRGKNEVVLEAVCRLIVFLLGPPHRQDKKGLVEGETKGVAQLTEGLLVLGMLPLLPPLAGPDRPSTLRKEAGLILRHICLTRTCQFMAGGGMHGLVALLKDQTPPHRNIHISPKKQSLKDKLKPRDKSVLPSLLSHTEKVVPLPAGVSLAVDCLTHIFAMQLVSIRDLCGVLCDCGLLGPVTNCLRLVVDWLRKSKESLKQCMDLSESINDTRNQLDSLKTQREADKSHRRGGSAPAPSLEVKDVKRLDQMKDLVEKKILLLATLKDDPLSLEILSAQSLGDGGQINTRPSEVLSSRRGEEMIALANRQERHVTIKELVDSLSKILHHFAHANLRVKMALSRFGTYHCMMSLIPDLPVDALALVLKTLSQMAVDCAVLSELLAHGQVPETTMRNLVCLLDTHKGQRRDIVSSSFQTIYYLSAFDTRQQEQAAMAGVIPHIQSTIIARDQLKVFAIPILFRIAKSTSIARKLLAENQGIQLLCDLLDEPSNCTQSLDALADWAAAEPNTVGGVLGTPSNVAKVVKVMKETKTAALFEELSSPLRKIIRCAALCVKLGQEPEFVSELKARILGHSECNTLRLTLLGMLEEILRLAGDRRQLIMDNDLLPTLAALSKDETSILVQLRACALFEWCSACVELSRQRRETILGAAIPRARREVPQEAMWQPDHESQLCHLCHARFTMINRRHHCRRCGYCVCGKCSHNKRFGIWLRKFKRTLVRVCDSCVVHLDNTVETASLALSTANNTRERGHSRVQQMFNKFNSRGKPKALN